MDLQLRTYLTKIPCSNDDDMPSTMQCQIHKANYDEASVMPASLATEPCMTCLQFARGQALAGMHKRQHPATWTAIDIAAFMDEGPWRCMIHRWSLMLK